MATSPAEEVSSEDEIFFGELTLKEIRARFLPKEKRLALRYANRKKGIKRNGSDTCIKIIEMHSEPEMDIENDWTESSYATTASNKADYNIKSHAENIPRFSLLPDDSFLRLEKQVADCSISDDIFQNHTSEIKFCFDPPSNKQPMIAYENVAKTEQNNLLCNNNRDGLFQLEQDCKPKIQVQDDTLHKHNPPTEENTNQIKPDVSSQHDSAKSERTPLKNNNFLDSPVTEVISTPRENENKIDIFKTPKNSLSKKQQASSVTKSLRKVNAYQHVTSPVALYIKHSSQAPLVHNMNPKQLAISHIPKLIKNPVNKISYKENTPLPTNVYRTPKKILVKTPDQKKISKDQHSNIKASTSAVIRKHASSEGNLKKEIVFQDDTINESLISQPDLSVHIV